MTAPSSLAKIAFSYAECASLLSVSLQTIRKLVRLRKINAVRLSYRVVRIPATEIDRLLTGRKGQV